MNEAEKKTQLFLMILAREIDNALKTQFETDLDFGVVLFEKGQGGSANFIANSHSRPEVVKALRSAADRLEALPEPNRIPIDPAAIVVDPNSHN